MTQEGLGALPGLGIRAGRAVLRWNKASRLMRRKTSTDMVNLNVGQCTSPPEYKIIITLTFNNKSNTANNNISIIKTIDDIFLAR